MDMEVLKAELSDDPLIRGYASMSDLEAADDLNEAYRSVTRNYVFGWEIFNATNESEYATLNDAQKSSWDALCAIDQIDTSCGVSKAREAELFGPGTATRSNLIALRNPAASRATELGLGMIKPGHISEARRI